MKSNVYSRWVSCLPLLMLVSGSLAAPTGQTPDEQAQAAQPPLEEPRRSLSDFASDTVITTKVKAALLAEASIGPLEISVATRDGTVTLSGEISDPAHAKTAEEVARKVEGVNEVVDELKIKSP